MMLKRVLIILAVLVCIMQTEAGVPSVLLSKWGKQKAPLPPTVRVLILHDKEDALIDIRGKYKVYDPWIPGCHIDTRLTGKAQVIQAIQDGLKWGEEFPGRHQVEFVPASDVTRIFVNGKEYKGTIQVYDVGGTISIVNELPIEDFIVSLIPNQFRDPLPFEVAAAIAIMTRTNAYYWSQNPRGKPYWDIDARQIGYRGWLPDDMHNMFAKAVRTTQFMVLNQGDPFENAVTTFPVQWDPPLKQLYLNFPKPESSKISLEEARKLAQAGQHAAVILGKAFPDANIQLIHFAEK